MVKKLFEDATSTIKPQNLENPTRNRGFGSWWQRGFGGVYCAVVGREVGGGAFGEPNGNAVALVFGRLMEAEGSPKVDGEGGAGEDHTEDGSEQLAIVKALGILRGSGTRKWEPELSREILHAAYELNVFSSIETTTTVDTAAVAIAAAGGGESAVSSEGKKVTLNHKWEEVRNQTSFDGYLQMSTHALRNRILKAVAAYELSIEGDSANEDDSQHKIPEEWQTALKALGRLVELKRSMQNKKESKFEREEREVTSRKKRPREEHGKPVSEGDHHPSTTEQEKLALEREQFEFEKRIRLMELEERKNDRELLRSYQERQLQLLERQQVTIITALNVIKDMLHKEPPLANNR